MSVKVIKATAVPGGKPEGTGPRKLRVCAYCRVSTDSEEQESSYEAQVSHYTRYIRSNANWRLAGIYADEGITGTSVRKREEFNRMIEACEKGEIDMVITKSISRFARNTLDCLQYIRRLKALGIPILFEKEGINTMDPAGEVLVTIMASIAQQESKSISDNVRMGIVYGFQEGKGLLNYTNFLGYRGTGVRGELTIVPREAELIRRIYRRYLEGWSPYMIAALLEERGETTATGGKRWYNSTIYSILGNEKYCGSLLMQKYYTEDFLTHRLVKNRGQRPQYYVEDHHEPIVPKTVFYQVQGEWQRRGTLMPDPSKLRFGSRLALNGRLYCGCCGSHLRRSVREEAAKTTWRCRGRSSPPPGAERCTLRIIREREAQGAVLCAFDRVPAHRGELEAERRQVRSGPLRELDERLGELEELWETRERELETLTSGPGKQPVLTVGEAPGRRSRGREAALRRELEELRKQRTALLLERAEHANREMQLRILLELIEQMGGESVPEPEPESPACTDYEDFFRRTRYAAPPDLLGPSGTLLRFDNDLVIRFLERVEVEETGYLVCFKAGVREWISNPEAARRARTEASCE